MDQKKLKIAYHEAGHAVMALVCHQGVKSVSLKEMDSPLGTGKYLGSTILEPFEQNPTLTINEATRRVMISLGGFASEILLFDGLTGIGGDDLEIAVKWTDLMMQSEDFKKITDTLPIPEPSALDHLISNPSVRAFIDYQLEACVKTLAPHKSVIQFIGEKLYEREEITGTELIEFIDSFVVSR